MPLPRPARRRILVVGSNVDEVENLVLLLREMGYDVEFSLNTSEALSMARSFQPELVLLDLAQSPGHGYEAARRLSREAGLDRTRVCALIGSGQQHDERRWRDLGCEVRLVKPVDAASLEHFFAQPFPPPRQG